MQEDGISAFTRGMVSRMVRRSVTPALTWTIYEQIMGILRASIR